MFKSRIIACALAVGVLFAVVTSVSVSRSPVVSKPRAESEIPTVQTVFSPLLALTGFMLGEDSKEVWGRPVGLLQLADGSLLLSEDGNNKIWRISFKG